MDTDDFARVGSATCSQNLGDTGTRPLLSVLYRLRNAAEQSYISNAYDLIPDIDTDEDTHYATPPADWDPREHYIGQAQLDVLNREIPQTGDDDGAKADKH